MKYILVEENRIYYICEGEASYNIKDATHYSSLEDIFKKVPIMRDWNWSYEIFELDGNNKKLINESDWREVYRKMDDDNLTYQKNNKVIPAFIRTIKF